jgi:N-acyl-D-amino-acid deacylase
MGPETPKFNDKVYQVIELLDKARKRGIEITYDSLSYPGGCTTVMAIFPPWSYENGTDMFLNNIKDNKFYGKIIEYLKTFTPSWPTWEGDGWTDNFSQSLGWDNLFILGAKNKEIVGKSFSQIAKERKTDIYTALRDVIIEENADMNLYFRGSRGAVTFDDDEDLKYFDMLIESEFSYVAVDAIFSKEGNPTYTPYMYGAYPRIIERYVKKKKSLTLKEAIERFTSKAADRMKLDKRGYLRKGYYADITVIDYDNYRDYPVILEQQKYSEGVDYLIINGEVIIENGEYKKIKAGRVIKNKN